LNLAKADFPAGARALSSLPPVFPMPTITLPDGSRREFDAPVRVIEVAEATLSPAISRTKRGSK